MGYKATREPPRRTVRERTLPPRAAARAGDHRAPLLPEPLRNRGTRTRSVVDRTGHQPDHHRRVPGGEDPLPAGLPRAAPPGASRDDGKPRCVACYMCATICPAQCIYIEAGEYQTRVGRTPPSLASSRSTPPQFVIDELRCIVCGLCVDACPKDAIRMDTYEHTPSLSTPGRASCTTSPSCSRGRRCRTSPTRGTSGPTPRSRTTSTWSRTPASARGSSVQPKAPEHHAPRTIVSTDQPVPVVKFLK